MFGGKKIQEAQNRIQYLEKVQSDYRHLVDHIRKTKTVSDEAFAALKVQDVQLDQGLNSIVDVLKDSKADNGKYAEQTEQLAKRLKELAEAEQGTESTEAESEKLSEVSKQTIEQLEEITEFCEGAAKLQQESRNFKEQVMEQSFAELDKMQETAKNMSTLALNAAIEAGRLGTSGVGFLQATEEVRKLSEEYAKMVENVTEQLRAMQKIQEESDAAEYIVKISKKVKETEDIAKEIKCETVSKTGDISEALKEQQKAAEDIAEGIRQAETRYQTALDQMELIGQNYIEGKQTKEELEEQLSGVYDKVV